ncbi:hypothetical protein HD554DRAFT_2179724 [Boletus coccyginus]|nr:hypothetical protein HD554DRAFT_2179724 [Boletus coccyginus]
MGKRKCEFTEDDYERVKAFNNVRQKRRREGMTEEERQEVRLRNREEKRKSRQRMREARLQPSLHVEGAPESASQSAARAAVEEAVQRLLFSTPGASPRATHPRLSPVVDPRLLEEGGIAATQKPPPPCPPSGTAMAVTQAVAPRAVSPLPSLPDPAPPQDSSPDPEASDTPPEGLALSPIGYFEGNDATYAAGPSSPRNTPSPSPAPSSPLSTPPPSPGPNGGQPRDITLGVIGTQVGHGAKTVQWTDGPLTILPYLGKKRGGSIRNVLSKDAKYVSNMADFPAANLQSELVVFLDRRMAKCDLLSAAREALSSNKTVVIRGYMEDETFAFTMEELSDHFMSSPDKPMGVHDMEKRVKNFTNPFVSTTVKQFVDDIHNPDVVRVALDFPLPQKAAPPPFDLLDDGLCLGWAQTQGDIPVDNQMMPGDVWTVRSWGIAHHAGILTYPHHDAEGAGTFVAPLAGIKNWMIIVTKARKQERGQFMCLLTDLTDSQRLLSDLKQQVDAETIHLYPGDLAIMPPGQMHGVNTPNASFCRGGHYFNLDTMHLTELSRFVDASRGNFVTNATHRGTLETLCRLVLALPILPRTRKLYKRSLIALCGMVAFPNQYTMQGQPHLRSVTLEPATKISTAVLNHFGLENYKAYHGFLSDPSTDMFDRGQEVDVYDILSQFRNKA